MYIFEIFENVKRKGNRTQVLPTMSQTRQFLPWTIFHWRVLLHYNYPTTNFPNPKSWKELPGEGEFSRVGIAQWHFFLGAIVLWYLSWNSFTLPASSLLPMQQLKTSMGTKCIPNSLFKLSRLPVVSLKYILVKKICSLKYN